MNEDDEPEVELSGEREGAPLDASNVPIIVSVSQVGMQELQETLDMQLAAGISPFCSRPFGLFSPVCMALLLLACLLCCLFCTHVLLPCMSQLLQRYSDNQTLPACLPCCLLFATPPPLLLDQVGNRSVVDLASEEEPCAAASLHVAVNSKARVVGLTKSGSSGLDPSLTQVSLAEHGQLLCGRRIGWWGRQWCVGVFWHVRGGWCGCCYRVGAFARRSTRGRVWHVALCRMLAGA